MHVRCFPMLAEEIRDFLPKQSIAQAYCLSVAGYWVGGEAGLVDEEGVVVNILQCHARALGYAMQRVFGNVERNVYLLL